MVVTNFGHPRGIPIFDLAYYVYTTQDSICTLGVRAVAEHKDHRKTLSKSDPFARTVFLQFLASFIPKIQRKTKCILLLIKISQLS